MIVVIAIAIGLVVAGIVFNREPESDVQNIVAIGIVVAVVTYGILAIVT